MDARIVLAVWTIAALLIELACARLWRRPLVTATGDGPQDATTRLMRLGWAAGLPWAALITGAVSRAGLGLGSAAQGLIAGFAPERWLAGAGTAALVVGLGIVVSAGIQKGTPPRASGAAGAFLTALSETSRWAWNRALPIALLGDPMIGALAGLGLSAVDWLIPAGAQALVAGPSRARVALTILRALCSTAMFMLTANVWLTLAAHLGLSILAPRLQSFAWQPDPSSS